MGLESIRHLLKGLLERTPALAVHNLTQKLSDLIQACHNTNNKPGTLWCELLDSHVRVKDMTNVVADRMSKKGDGTMPPLLCAGYAHQRIAEVVNEDRVPVIVYHTTLTAEWFEQRAISGALMATNDTNETTEEIIASNLLVSGVIIFPESFEIRLSPEFCTKPDCPLVMRSFKDQVLYLFSQGRTVYDPDTGMMEKLKCDRCKEETADVLVYCGDCGLSVCLACSKNCACGKTSEIKVSEDELSFAKVMTIADEQNEQRQAKVSQMPAVLYMGTHTNRPANCTSHETIESFGSVQHCANCHRSGIDLKVCGRCKRVAYCSKGCQTAHWKTGHKDRCR